MSDFDVTHHVTVATCRSSRPISCSIFFRDILSVLNELPKPIPWTGMIPNDVIVSKLHKEQFFLDGNQRLRSGVKFRRAIDIMLIIHLNIAAFTLRDDPRVGNRKKLAISAFNLVFFMCIFASCWGFICFMNSTTSTDKAKDGSRISRFCRPKRHHKGGSLIGYL